MIQHGSTTPKDGVTPFTLGGAAATEALALHPLFRGISRNCIDAVAAAGMLKTAAAGTVLGREGEAARAYWLVCSGSVRVYGKLPRHREVTLQLMAAPGVWGDTFLLDDRLSAESCVTLEKSQLFELPREAFHTLLRTQPEFTLAVLRESARRSTAASQHQRAIAFLNVEERLVHLLLSYVRTYGVPVAEGTMIRIRVSQLDLAKGLGVALKSISRAMQKMFRDRLLLRRGHHYVVTNETQLRTRVSAPPTLRGPAPSA